MARTKKEKVPTRLEFIRPIDTGSDAYLRNMEDIMQKAEEQRQAADTLLRLQLVRDF